MRFDRDSACAEGERGAMRIALVHALPLEYYPPTRNLIEILARCSWEVRVWSTHNRRGLPHWTADGVRIDRIALASPTNALPFRMAGYLRWHLQTAFALTAWKPDAVISIEPHSALAVWTYLKLVSRAAALFIHHHEYYAPADFDAPGMRFLRAIRRLERDDLFARAKWVSQTNDQRLRLLLEDSPSLSRRIVHAMPNYPPADWIAAASVAGQAPPSGLLRLVYVGAASFEDTFIREAVEWVISNPGRVSLYVCGDNIQRNVVDWIRSVGSRDVTINEKGVAYEALASLLPQFDVGLVLYRGNTSNFVHNVPNKAIEYLACGLQVWYPRVMQGMVSFHEQYPAEDLREMEFQSLPAVPPAVMRRSRSIPFPFTAERAVAPLMAELGSIESQSG